MYKMKTSRIMLAIPFASKMHFQIPVVHIQAVSAILAPKREYETNNDCCY